jgi:hypothetical protein
MLSSSSSYIHNYLLTYIMTTAKPYEDISTVVVVIVVIGGAVLGP